MRDLVLTIAVFGALPIVFLRPHLGMLVWVGLSIMNPHRLTWGFAYDFPFAEIVAITLLAGTLMSKEKSPFPLSAPIFVLALFVGWMTLTSFFALAPPEDVWKEWERTMKIQLMVFLALKLMNTPERLKLLTWAIVLSLGFFGAKGGLFTILTGGKYLVTGPAGSFIEDNNAIGLALVMVIPLMRYLQVDSANKWIRRGLLVGMILTGFGIVGTHSRGALVGVVAMVLFMLAKSPKKAPLALALVVVIPLIIAFMPQKWSERMGSIATYEQDASAMGRLNSWQFATNLALDNPLGGGFQTFTQELFYRYAPRPGSFHDAHSIYFEVLGEHGFGGLFLFLLFWGLVWLKGKKLIKAMRDIPEYKSLAMLAAMTQVSLVGYAVGGAFLGLAYFDLPYYLAVIIIMADAYVKRAPRGTPVKAQVRRENGRLIEAPLQSG